MSTITPINRWTEKEGTTYRVYNKMSPHYYMDKTGSYHSIDVTNLQTITKDTVGEIKLREKNVASVGFRIDGNKTKYLGMRPDETQEDGTHQLEWTVEEAIINNTTQSITLNQTSSIDDITTNLGGQVVRSTRNYTRQMVPVTGSIDNFQVKYKLHLTGLQISNSKYTEDTIIRNNISSSGTITTGTSHYISDNGYFKITDTNNDVKFQISLPVLLKSDFGQLTNDTTHTLKDNGDNTYEYIKYPSDSLLSSGISGSVRYIDATTIYSTAALDGYAARSGIGTSWNAVHDHAQANTVESDATGSAYAIRSAGELVFNFHALGRAFFSFDTSGISVNPSSATLNIKTHTNNAVDIIAIEATHTAIDTITYNDFTGWETGWDGDAEGSEVVPYSLEIADVASDGSFTTIDLLPTALTAIGSNDTTKICIMGYDYDFKDFTGPASIIYTGFYFSDNSGTSSDPYLEITEALDLISGPLKLKGGKLSILGGRLVIK